MRVSVRECACESSRLHVRVRKYYACTSCILAMAAMGCMPRTKGKLISARGRGGERERAREGRSQEEKAFEEEMSTRCLNT